MGGFIGYIGKRAKEKQIIEMMGQAISHRGAEVNYYNDEMVALVERRIHKNVLREVLTNEAETMILVSDAMIYNYDELKQELVKKGHNFKTTLNSEIIIHGYEEYGEEIVSLLNGPFAFVIWDKKKQELFGARDIFGIKPFYYYQTNDVFMFGSEIKGFISHPYFKKEINKEALKPYLIFQYSVLDETFFKNVFRLKPRHYFKYKNGKLKVTNYYDFKYVEKKTELSVLTQGIHQTIVKAVAQQKKSTQKLGSFLSGGIDSSYLASILKPKVTYSVGFDYDGFDETSEAKELSKILKMDNKRKLITGDDFFGIIEKVQYHSDEPHANLSAVPLYFLSELAHKDTNIVVSGEGADELYGGYDTYKQSKFLLAYRKLPLKIRTKFKNMVINKPKFKGKNFLIKGGSKIEDYYIGQAFIFNDDEANRVLTTTYQSKTTFKSITMPYFEKVKEKNDLVKMQYLDMNLWLPNDILLKADKMAMAHGLEVRMPFLDKNVFNHSLGIPSKYKVDKGVTKYGLREASKETLPIEWSTRKKKGFLVPFSIWLKEEKHYRQVKEVFNADYSKEFFDILKINELLDAHYHGLKNTTRQVYTIYTFLVWYKVYFK